MPIKHDMVTTTYFNYKSKNRTVGPSVIGVGGVSLSVMFNLSSSSGFYLSGNVCPALQLLRSNTNKFSI